jgi:hypothetical protein
MILICLFTSFFKDELEVEEVVEYSDGQKDVIYEWVGRLERFTVDFVHCVPPNGCRGNVDMVRNEYR